MSGVLTVEHKYAAWIDYTALIVAKVNAIPAVQLTPPQQRSTLYSTRSDLGAASSDSPPYTALLTQVKPSVGLATKARRYPCDTIDGLDTTQGKEFDITCSGIVIYPTICRLRGV